MSDVQNVWTTDFNALLMVVTHVKNDCLRQLKKQVNTKTKGIGNNVGSFFLWRAAFCFVLDWWR